MKISKKVKLELYKALEKEENIFPSDDDWMKFLDEIWDLRTLPSEDERYPDAYEDIVQHEDFFLERLKLLESNKIFIKFLNTLVNPNFRKDIDAIMNLVLLINSYIEKENLILAVESYNDYEVPVYQVTDVTIIKK